MNRRGFVISPAIMLRPESDVRFFSADLDTAVTFRKDKDGTLTALTLDQGGRQTSAERGAMGRRP